MSEVVVALVWCATLAWCVNRVVVFAESLVRPAVEAHADPMPVDVAAQITAMYTEDWAMQDAMSAADELYRRTKSWDVVRQRMFAVMPTREGADG